MLLSLLSPKLKLVEYSILKINNNDGHIITSFAFSSIYVGRQQSVEQTFCDFVNFHFPLHLYVDVVNDLLACFGLPNAVTAHYYEIGFVGNLMHFYFWQRGDCLLVKLELQVFLVCDVTDGS